MHFRTKLLLALTSVGLVAAAAAVAIQQSTSEVAAPADVPTTRPSAGAIREVPAGQYPTPATTGVPAGTTLILHPGDLVVTTPGEVVDGMHVTGDIDVQADGVVIRNTQIDGRVHNQGVNLGRQGHWRFQIEDSTVGRVGTCSSSNEGAIGVDNFTALRVQIVGFSDGFRVSGDHVFVQDSFYHACDLVGGHSDGVQGNGGGTDVRVFHSTFDSRVKEGENAAIFFADNSRQGEFRDNLMMGGGWTFRLHDESWPDKAPQDLANYIAVGNRVVADSWGFGPKAVDDCDKHRSIVWDDNRLVTMGAEYQVTAVGAVIPC